MMTTVRKSAQSLFKYSIRPCSSRKYLNHLTSTSHFSSFQPRILGLNPQIRTTQTPKWGGGGVRREYCSGGVDYNRVVDEINLKFAEAREDIDAAMESKETVYFDEEAEMARDSVKEVLDMFDSLLARLEDKEKGSLQRSMGLKMEQLKAELQQLND